MPNYHLFASCGIDKANDVMASPKSINPKKKKIDLDLLYRRTGCRSIKTLLSANQADVWNDTTVNVTTDLISTSDHHIATIKKRLEICLRNQILI